MIRSSTIYEVLVAMLIFICVATISFYMLLNIQHTTSQKYDTLKYEGIINAYRINSNYTLDNSIVINIEDELYDKSNDFLLRKYELFSDSEELLYVKFELIPIDVK